MDKLRARHILPSAYLVSKVELWCVYIIEQHLVYIFPELVGANTPKDTEEWISSSMPKDEPSMNLTAGAKILR